MLEIIDHIKVWKREERNFAIATVVQTWRSAPRGVGSSLIVDSEGNIQGSVSGGCVEGAVAKAALEVLERDVPQLLKFGVSNEDAWAVGLSCGGAISVYVQPFWANAHPQVWEATLDHLGKDIGFALSYQQDGVSFYSTIYQQTSSGHSSHEVVQHQLEQRDSKWVQDDYFIHVFPPQNHMIIVGAAHVTHDLMRLALQQDFKVTVIDPRGMFHNSLSGDIQGISLLRSWPAEVLPDIKLDSSVYAVLLTHDPKIDDQALHILLNKPVSYIGALGSRKTHARRIRRLQDAGFPPGQIENIKGPIGLNIGAKGASEIALSIMSQVIQVKNGLTG